MLELNQADLSAIYQSPITTISGAASLSADNTLKNSFRRPSPENLSASTTVGSNGKPANSICPPAAQSKPGPVEFAWHNALGRVLTVYDSLVRAFFEFMPLPWLRVYRLLRNWVVNPPSGVPDEKTSLLKDFKQHWLTILSATALLGVVIFLHLHANPHLMFLLFYAIPCALLALVVNTAGPRCCFGLLIHRAGRPI